MSLEGDSDSIGDCVRFVKGGLLDWVAQRNHASSISVSVI